MRLFYLAGLADVPNGFQGLAIENVYHLLPEIGHVKGTAALVAGKRERCRTGCQLVCITIAFNSACIK